jgi:Concanavalin A-like lectin/glucanases superfamily/Secretion system C-terminal sorting domain
MKTLLLVLLSIAFSSRTLLAQFEGQALQFDGIDDYVSFGNPTVFDVDTAVTYEAWIRPDTTPGFIFNKWVNFQEDKQLTYSGDKVTFYIHNVFSGVSLVSASSVPMHQYTHVAATYDGSMAKLYINGVFDTSKSVGNPVSNSSGVLYLAHNPDRFDVQSAFMGVIDEFRIWSTARTESEIQSTMNQTLNGNEPGLIGYWNFNEGNGSTTADQTSNGNDGTISGAVWIPGSSSVENENKLPETFLLSQNYPNPFNPATKINYDIPQSSFVNIKVYDVLGNEIETLVNEQKLKGNYEINFDASRLASGIYFYQLQAGSFISTKKMILIK